MKKIAIILLCLVAGFFLFNQGQAETSKDTEECYIYFVDRRLHRLIPLPFSPLRTPEKTAKKIVSDIIDGKGSNPEILRLFPEIQDCISVRVISSTAYVNLLGTLSSHMNKNLETERLFIYQIVNSLTSITGIDYVRFTIDNETKKDFLGFLDMREIFTADCYM